MAAVELTPTREAAGMDRSLAPPSKGKTMTNGPDIDGVPQYGKQLGEDIEDGDGGDLLANPSVFQVIGTNCQILNIQLQPKQKVLCEPGSLMHGSSEMVPSTKCFWSCSRACSGESQFVTRFRNEGSTPAVLGLTVPVPNAKVVPVDLDDEYIGNRLHCLKGSWMATLGQAHVSFDLDCGLAALCGFGNVGVRRQIIEGRGVVFLVGGGTVLRREMDPHERLVLEDHALLAWSGTVGYASRASSSGGTDGDGKNQGLDRCWRGACCGACFNWTGEGAFNFVITGGSKGGVIFIQSMPFAKFRKALQPSPTIV